MNGKNKALSFSKFEVKALLELIAGGGKQLTVEQFQHWRELILYAIESMRLHYEENPHVDKDYSVSVYYRPCWEKIKTAEKDDKKLIEEIEFLRSSIQWE